MALVPGNVGDNPFVPGVAAELYIPDQLIAGEFKIVTDNVTVKTPSNLLRGTVVGAITLGAASSATKGGGNTGNGTFVLDVTTPVLANAYLSGPGVYTLRCITAVANGGVFRLEDPKGNVLGDFTIPPGAGNSVTISERIKGVLTDAATDFIVGDGFDITIAAGSGKVVIAVATATDGSNIPVGILVDDANATAADVSGAIYMTGEFNGNKLILDASYTLTTITPLLRAISIFVKTAIQSINPT
jgi:hypothetical protein